MSSEGLRSVLYYIRGEYGDFREIVFEVLGRVAAVPRPMPDIRTIEETKVDTRRETMKAATEEPSTTTPAIPGPVALRHVVFNDEAGIYLGPGAGTQGFWSLTNPGGIADAPTFLNSMEVYDHAKLKGVELREHRLIEVQPDLPDNRVSSGACINRCLPGWSADG